MLPDDTKVMTPHGESTVRAIKERDIPYWEGVIVHARQTLSKYEKLIQE